MRRVYSRARPEVILLAAARCRAKRAGLPCTITQDDIRIPTHCPALGWPLVLGDGRVGPQSPTLDKIVPDLGYVPGNVLVVSHLANRIKSNATPDQILAVATFYKEKRRALLSN